MLRDGLSEDAARMRTNAQKPDSFYIEHSHTVLVNDADEKKFDKLIREHIDEWIKD